MSTSHPTSTDTGPASRPSGRIEARPDKREAILTAALELFVERGFYGTAVPEIADRAGVGAGTIYRYFESKEALVNVIYREQKQALTHLVLGDFPHTAPTREQFRTLWSRMARFAVAHPEAFIFLEVHHHARYLDADSRAVEARMIDLVVAFVAAAQARHELKPGVAKHLIGLVTGAFVGLIRACLETATPLDQADWVLAEQCMWEAVRT
jgi:AcrR family transcriptional regulator